MVVFGFFLLFVALCNYFFYFCRLIEMNLVQYLHTYIPKRKIEVMCKKAMKHLMTALLIAVAAPFVKAQVHVGDILCEDNTVVSPASFVLSEHNAIGVVFYVDATRQHGWAVGLNDIGEYAWGPNCIDTRLRNCSTTQQAMNDINGYANTKAIIEGGYGIEFPAFDSLDFDNGWYLPAIGQLKRLYSNLKKVDESLSAVGGSPFSNNGEWEYWSSTENYICEAWYIDSFGRLKNKDHSYNGDKDDRRFVRGVINF